MNANKIVESVNIVICDKNIVYYVVEDSLIDIISNNEKMSSAVSKNKEIHQLYDWLADTNTISHITYRQDAFATYKLTQKIPINLAGKNKSFAIAKGLIFLQSKCEGIIHILQLNNVLHIPNTDHSLLSLGCWEQMAG